MRKVIKILGKVLSAIVLLLIILPISISTLLTIPVVQNFVVHKASEIISSKLETTVSIGRVDIGLLSKIKIYDFYVEDYQQDTLLYAGYVETFVTGLGLRGGGITLGRAEVDNAKLCLRQTPDSSINIKQIIDRMVNKDKPSTGSFKMTIASASIKNINFSFERLDRKNPPFGIDYSNMQLHDIRAYVNNLTIDGATVAATISSLSAREQSGFVLDNLAGNFYLTEGCLGFEKMKIVTEKSNVQIPYVSIVGSTWEDYAEFLGRVEINALVEQTTLSSDDIAYFAPTLERWHTTFTNVNLTLEGCVDNFKTSISGLGAGPHTRLAIDASVRGLPDIRNTNFDVEVRKLSSSAADIDHLAESIGGAKLSPKILKFVDNGGMIALTGNFNGSLSSFRMKTALATQVGAMDCNLYVQPTSGGRSKVRGGITAHDVRIGELLGVPKLGSTTLMAQVDGVVGNGYADAKITGDIAKLEFNGYSYDSIRLDGHMYNKKFNGSIIARDPNLDFDFAGFVDLNDTVPRYDFSLDLHRADLARLNINPRDSISEISASVVAKAAGRSFDDLNGMIRISDVVYRYNDNRVEAKLITVQGENYAQSKFVELSSDFADVTFRSKTSYKEVIEYLKMSAWKYLPILYDKDKYVSRDVQQTVAVDDYSLLSVQIKNINPLVDAVAQGLQIADGSKLQLLFNPAGDKISLRASSDYVERDRLLATKININAANHGDSLAFYAASEDFYMGGLHLRELSLTGGAREGRLQLNTGFNDTLRHVSGMLGIRASLEPEPGPDGRVLNVRILPSHIRRNDVTWRIFASRIALDTARVVVDRFMVMNDQQELFIDGVASRSSRDSVRVRLRNFDLAPLTQFVEGVGYVVEGITNGTATIKSALRESEISANIQVDSLRVNGIQAPPMQLVSRWDFKDNRAGFVVNNRLSRDTLVRGFYAPSQMRYYARMSVDSLDLGLLNPVLQGVISDTKGRAKVDLVLTGQHRNAELRGKVIVKGLSTHVDFTNVSYSVPEVTLNVDKNHFAAKNVAVFDPDGNRGSLDFDLNLEHLSNIAYNLHVSPQEMLVLNTTALDNDLFHGKVYATGAATISGDKRGVNMDVAATTEGNSNFNMSLTGKSNLSTANFVIFEAPREADTTNLLSLKKQSFERRQKDKTQVQSAMNISLALNVQPNLDFQLVPLDGNVIRGRGEGLLNLDINPRMGIFEMYGDYTISEGTYHLSLENFLTRKFIIENGSTILWTGSPMSAMLNISAVYKLKASLTPLLQGTTSGVSGDRSVPVECLIHLGDLLINPSIRFDVRVPLADAETQAVVANALTPETVNTQFAYLLFLNSFMPESSGVSANIGASVSAASGLEFLSSQISQLLSNDALNVVIRYRPRTELTSDEVDFGLSRSLINNRLFVEVEGNYVVDNKQSANRNMSNFMGEAYITWLIDRAGTLKLKGFTQTIDRFDENQGLQETGIGIYYKEDFNNFKDLRERVKERFSSKKRKAKRESRRAATEAEAGVRRDSVGRVESRPAEVPRQ